MYEATNQVPATAKAYALVLLAEYRGCSPMSALYAPILASSSAEIFLPLLHENLPHKPVLNHQAAVMETDSIRPVWHKDPAADLWRQ